MPLTRDASRQWVTSPSPLASSGADRRGVGIENDPSRLANASDSRLDLRQANIFDTIIWHDTFSPDVVIISVSRFVECGDDDANLLVSTLESTSRVLVEVLDERVIFDDHYRASVGLQAASAAALLSTGRCRIRRGCSHA